MRRKPVARRGASHEGLGQDAERILQSIDSPARSLVRMVT
ncbi:hypothetical protein P3T37_001183 [Kitasatospora sp. MAA4]|nr:hypothetical protein [Kitasatospora sp. MAA4]